MCLYNPEKIDTEGKDIKVYKVILVKTDCYGFVRYLSPYFRYMKSSEWNLGETNHSETFKGSHDKSVVKRDTNINGEEEYVVTDNAFHSFKNLSDAIEELSFLRWRERVGMHPCDGAAFAIGRFTIPGDSKYVYTGGTLSCTSSSTGENFAKSYASESLRFDGLVENEA